jgi:hypothetical protein
MGTKITKLQPFGGFCAETAGAITPGASRSRPPTPSPARSWASAPRAASRRSSGASPAASSGRGS